jgi:Fic family protein
MDTSDLLKEILKWQKIQGLSAFKSLIPILLDSKEKRAVYEMTDGTLTVKQISEKAKVATGTVSNWWNKWLAEGILYRDGNKYIKIASIKDLFLESGGKNG